MAKLIWEELTGNGPSILMRTWVPAGWLVTTSKEQNANLVFVSDPLHEWLKPGQEPITYSTDKLKQHA